MIIAEKVSLKVGLKSILDDVSVQIPFAKVTAILGPNGAGKSTLLKCLTGAKQCDSGKININGQAIDSYSLESLSRLRAVLSQATPVDFPFTALEIVRMGRNPHDNDSSAGPDDDIAHKALEIVDALAMKDRVFPTLSGGEQQRIQLARVVAQLWGEKSVYLFLDEPTSALDLKHQHQVLKFVAALAENRNMAIIIVLHDLNLALRYADQVVLLKDGKLFASGDTSEVLTAKNIESVFDVSVDSIFYGGGIQFSG
jgi:iron complex transport system ATP-binding protein